MGSRVDGGIYRGGSRDPVFAIRLKFGHRIRKLLLRDQHLELGRDPDWNLSHISHKVRERICYYLLGDQRQFDRIRGYWTSSACQIPRQNSIGVSSSSGSGNRKNWTMEVCCVSQYVFDRRYGLLISRYPRSDEASPKEDGEENEQYRLFKDFQEYLLRLIGQGMGRSSILIPMRAVVITASPGHFASTFIDSSAKREDILVGWPDDNDDDGDKSPM